MAEETLFIKSKSASLPDRTDFTELIVQAVALESPLQFNGVVKPLESCRDAYLSGFDVVLDPQDPDNRVQSLLGAKDLRNLSISAERLFIRGKLHFPQTNVTIFAREIIFEDADPDAPAMIDTTPRDFIESAAMYKNGLSGTKGGDLILMVAEITIPGEANGDEKLAPQPRFVLRGGKGQKPGAGRHGKTKGKSYKSTKQTWKGTTYELTYYQNLGVTVHGSSKWRPTNGENATSGGRPGNGGDGGALSALVNVPKALLELGPGAPGDTLPTYKGAAAGTPNKWYHVNYDLIKGPLVLASGTARAGKSAPPKKGSAGKPGGLKKLDLKADAWLRPDTLQAAIEWIREADLAGHRELAEKECIRYLEIADSIIPLSDEELPLIDRQREELASLAHRLRRGLDYFGNPPGWAPMLSLDSCVAIYKAKVHDAVRTMYLAHLLEEQWAKEAERRQMVIWARDQFRDQATEAREDFNRALQLISNLQEEYEAIETETEKTLEKLAALEKLVAEAVENDENARRRWARVFRALEGACQSAMWFTGGNVAAAGALGGGGVVMGTIASELENRDVSVSDDAISGAFRDLIEDEELAEARQEFAEMNPAQAKDQAKYRKRLRELSQILSKQTRAYVDESIAYQLSQSEGGAVLADSQSQEDPFPKLRKAFDEMMDETAEVITRRQLFGLKVAETLQAMETAKARVMEADLALDTLDSAEERNAMDPRTQRTVREMARAAKDRLLRYKYAVVRSFEYRMLQPCPVDFRESRVFDDLVRLFGLDGRPPGTASELPLEGSTPQDLADSLKAQTERPAFGAESPLVNYLTLVYTSELEKIADMVVDDVVHGRRIQPKGERRNLTLNEEELRRLNRNRVVSIDLEERLIKPSDANARIANIVVLEEFSKFDGQSDESLSISCEPDRLTTLVWQGKRYQFTYATQAEANLDFWGCDWDSTNGDFDDNPASAAHRELLAQLVDPNMSHVRRLHMLPGARSKLIIRRAGAPEVAVEALVLKVDLLKNSDFKSANQ